MASKEKNVNIYDKCNVITKTKPEYEVDEKLNKDLATGYRVLPTFESTLFERVFINHFSLKRNKYLNCRWTEYKQNIEGRVFSPFQFPDIRDLHFCNCAVRFRPDATVHRLDHRMKMIPGPGVGLDLGLLPIPQEALMKRGKVEANKEKPATKSNNKLKVKKN